MNTFTLLAISQPTHCVIAHILRQIDHHHTIPLSGAGSPLLCKLGRAGTPNADWQKTHAKGKYYVNYLLNPIIIGAHTQFMGVNELSSSSYSRKAK